MQSPETLILKSYLSPKDLSHVEELQSLCTQTDKVALKLELEYRRYYGPKAPYQKLINEFLYYIDDTLISYLSISSWGGNIAEITGMTHPNYRREGYFSRLFSMAKAELHGRNFNKILLLTDHTSQGGAPWIKSQQGTYTFTEWNMTLSPVPTYELQVPVQLVKATPADLIEIQKQMALYFHDIEDGDFAKIDFDHPTEVHYMVKAEDSIIGTIKVTYEDTSGYISGFGILPEYRGKGYGKSALMESLNQISRKGLSSAYLDVVGTNDRAKGLYQSVGFRAISSMDYYELVQ